MSNCFQQSNFDARPVGRRRFFQAAAACLAILVGTAVTVAEEPLAIFHVGKKQEKKGLDQ